MIFPPRKNRRVGVAQNRAVPDETPETEPTTTPEPAPAEAASTIETEPTTTPTEPAKRGRGRPPGPSKKASKKPAKKAAKKPAKKAPAPAAAASDEEPEDLSWASASAEPEGETRRSTEPESASDRRERRATQRRRIVEAAPSIEALLKPLVGVVGHLLDLAAGAPIAGTPVQVARTTLRGEPSLTVAPASEAVLVATAEALALLAPERVAASIDHPLGAALTTVGGVALAIGLARLATLGVIPTTDPPSSPATTGAIVRPTTSADASAPRVDFGAA